MRQLDNFWRAFAAEHWEARPGVFSNPLGEELVSAARAFECSVEACTRWRQREPVSLRFFVENALVQSNPSKYLPLPEDANFHEYAARIAPQLGGQGFAFVLNGAARYDFDLFRRARRFLRGLYDRVGVPGDATDMDIFVGNYRHTPFGIHTDKASNFSFVLTGRKKFLLWPGPALKDCYEVHRSVDFESVRDQALVLEAEAGQVVYWPSSYWHIAESPGDLSAVLNVALYLEDTTEAFVGSALREPELAPTADRRTLPWDSAVHRGNDLPEQLEQALHALSKPRPLHAAQHGAALRAWLSRMSAYNFHRSYPPGVTPEALRPDMNVKGDTEFPILTRADGELLLCAAHGHVIEVAAVPAVERLIERLNTGREAPVLELIELARGDTRLGEQCISVSEQDVLLVLENLLAMRAIRVVR